MSGIEIVNGTIETHKVEMEQLLASHFEEVQVTSYNEDRNPNWEEYIRLEQLGSVFSLFVKKEGKLIGYSINFLTNHLHYSDLLIASNDAIFLDKQHRKGGLGSSLIRMSEDRARYFGAKVFSVNAVSGSPLAKVLPKIGYNIQDITHLKVL